MSCKGNLTMKRISITRHLLLSPSKLTREKVWKILGPKWQAFLICSSGKFHTVIRSRLTRRILEINSSTNTNLPKKKTLRVARFPFSKSRIHRKFPNQNQVGGLPDCLARRNEPIRSLADAEKGSFKMIDSPINFSHWHTEPALIGGLLFCCWIYALLVGTFRQNLCPRLAYSHKHTFWFSLGMLSFYLAVGSPLDPLGENFLFSAHMIQHNVLMSSALSFFFLDFRNLSLTGF